MQWGWPAAFYLTGALGFVWLAVWLLIYDVPERHPRVSPAELAYIRSDLPDPPARISWLSLLRYRQTWAYTLAMMLIVPVWTFYLYWMPKFLENNHGIKLGQVFWPLLVLYLIADVGSVSGGGLSSWLIRRGASVNVARKTAFLACAVCVMPVACVARVTDLWTAIVLVGVAAAAHQGYRRKHLHHRFRHGPAQGGQFRGRHRGHGRLREHAGFFHVDRLHPRLDRGRLRQEGLSDSVFDRRFSVPGGHGRNPPAVAAAGADELRRRAVGRQGLHDNAA